MDREQRLADTLVDVAGTLVDDFDVVDYLHRLTNRCTELLDVAATALLIGTPYDGLQLAAPFGVPPALGDLLAISQWEGPALECYRSASPLAHVDLAEDGRWPVFTAQARRSGYGSVTAAPLRLHHHTLGCLLLLRTTGTTVPPADVRVAQTLANAASLGILHDRTLRSEQHITTRLRTALHSRITIEQASGVLAARRDVDVHAALALMRHHAALGGRRLTDVARTVLAGGQPEEAGVQESGG